MLLHTSTRGHHLWQLPREVQVCGSPHFPIASHLPSPAMLCTLRIPIVHCLPSTIVWSPRQSPTNIQVILPPPKKKSISFLGGGGGYFIPFPMHWPQNQWDVSCIILSTNSNISILLVHFLPIIVNISIHLFFFFRTILYLSTVYCLGNALMSLTALPPPEWYGFSVIYIFKTLLLININNVLPASLYFYHMDMLHS